jgi:glyoxylase-like metal-dependent hydrolase (beta-lactamase superfamily II)
MIDTGSPCCSKDGVEQSFLTNLTTFLDESNMGIDKILISHAHHDHIGGLQDVLNLLKSRGQSAPKVFKYLDNNKFEKQIFEMHKDLNREEILPILDGDKYQIDDDLEL